MEKHQSILWKSLAKQKKRSRGGKGKKIIFKKYQWYGILRDQIIPAKSTLIQDKTQY